MKQLLIEKFEEPTKATSLGTYWKNKYGKLHRDNDMPAIIFCNGSRHWYKNGNLHRDNDKPALILADGSTEWYENNKRHRSSNKPAVVAKNLKQWFINGEFIKSNRKF